MPAKKPNKTLLTNRVQQIFNDLESNNLVSTQKEFWQSIDIANTAGSYMFAEEDHPDKRWFPWGKADILCERWGVNKDWLEFGIGDRYTKPPFDIQNNYQNPEIDSKEQSETTPRVIYRNEERIGYKPPVPYYDIQGTMSVVRSFSDMPVQPDFWVDFKPFNDCTAYITTYGDSMFPKYRSGQVLAIKQIFNIDFILWGEAYFVITDEETNNLRTVKLVHPDLENKNNIILRASNPSHKGDTVIPKRSIISMYIIKGDVNISHL